MVPGLPSRSFLEEQENARLELPIPYQAAIHLQYPTRLASRLHLQPVLRLRSAQLKVQG